MPKTRKSTPTEEALKALTEEVKALRAEVAQLRAQPHTVYVPVPQLQPVLPAYPPNPYRLEPWGEPYRIWCSDSTTSSLGSGISGS